MNKKIFDMENERKVKEAEIDSNIESVRGGIQTVKDRMQQVEELSYTFKSQADQIKQ